MITQFIRFGAAAAIGLFLVSGLLTGPEPASAEERRSAIPDARILEAFGRFPLISNLALSPDGSKIVQLVSTPEGQSVVIIDLASRKSVFRTSLPQSKIRDLLWPDNDSLIILRSTTAIVWGLENDRGEWMLGHKVDLNTKKVTNLLNGFDIGGEQFDAMNTLNGPPIAVSGPKGEPLLVITGWILGTNQGHSALFKQSTGRASLLDSGMEDTVDWAVSPT